MRDMVCRAFAYRFLGRTDDPKARLKWQSVDNPRYELDEETLLVGFYKPIETLTELFQPLPPPAENDASLPYDVSNIRNYSLALTGDVFRWIVEYGDTEVLKRVSLLYRCFLLLLERRELGQLLTRA